MARKLILTSFLIFFGEGWVQMAFGALVTFGFLLLNLAYRPYCTDGLNRWAASSNPTSPLVCLDRCTVCGNCMSC
jgi:hypothetical protein